MSLPSYAVEPVHELLAQVDPERELAPCGLRRLVLGSGALTAVAITVEELLSAPDRAPAGGGRPRVVLLVDRTPILRRGQDVKDVVHAQLAERFDVVRTVLDDGHADLHVVDEVLDAATVAVAGAAAVVAVGGGTISDIGKVAVHRTGLSGHRPVLISVQTAASVDGYTDNVSVVLRAGVKRTVLATWPDAVVADTETIVDAPPAMARAGFGEMTSMLVAPADWRLASMVGTDETFSAGAVRILDMVGEDIGTWSPGVRSAQPDAVARLTRALALRGIATGVAGTTAVLSGVEHLVSHMLDQHHTGHRQRTGLHGAQVGVATVVAAAAWEMLFDRLAGRSDAAPIDESAFDLDLARIRVVNAFWDLDPSGRIARECWRDYSAKLDTLTRHRSRVEGLLARWLDHEPDLRALVRPSAAVAADLRAAGAAVTFDELDPAVPPELARWAVAHCALMRNRVTVVDLLTLLGWWGPSDVDEVLDRAARAATGAVAEAREW